jgi:pSer/pThr/pTyr-binding forkhead associated (FHA) protein
MAFGLHPKPRCASVVNFTQQILTTETLRARSKIQERMNPQVSLMISDEFGNTREVLVQSKRFTIGRTPENDLAIPNSNLSRRHAVIEAFEGVVQITDCGSQNGTEVNGTTVVTSTILRDGDLISLAGVCDITVSISEDGQGVYKGPVAFQPRGSSQPQPQGFTSPARLGPKVPVASNNASWLGGLGIPLIAAVAVGMAVVVAGGLLLLILTSDRQQSSRTDRTESIGRGANLNATDQPNTAPSTPRGNEGLNSRSTDSSAGSERVEKVAIAVMQRISSDDKPYSFSDKALQDIGRKVGSYQNSSALAGYLELIQRNSAALGAMARHEGLEPGLLIYAVLAQTDGGRTNGEPLVVARGIISNLLAVRATFGTTDAESSLILLAAYRMGGGGKRSHPLLVTIRRLVKHPLTQRNVWYLNERGGLEPEVYDFVVSFLALAVIAQNPAQFGVSASPLVF